MKAFDEARSHGSDVIGIFIAAALSGTASSAEAAAQAADMEDITIVDSKTASLGLGMLTVRMAELIEDGWTPSKIASEIQRIRSQSGGFFTVDRFDCLLRSGRVSKGRAWLGGVLDIKPILEVNADGKVVPLDRVRGSAALFPRILQLLEERLTPRPKRLRIGIVHAAAKGAAEKLKLEVINRFSPNECYLEDVASVIGVHVGPGAWGVFYQIED